MKRILLKSLFISLSLVFGLTTIVLVVYLSKIYQNNQYYYGKYNSSEDVALRKFPYPYRAGLSISNDIDNTESLNEFLEISDFLNTRNMTTMGEGIGLETGNSFFFYEPPNYAIKYFSEPGKIKETIKRFIKAGRIDFIHSYGKKNGFTRQDAIVALAELEKNGLKIDVWVDHTVSNDNLGDDVTHGEGDHPDSEAYHADLTLEYGIKFAWLGRITMIAGQETPITLSSFLNIYNSEHFYKSIKNILKELIKNVIAIFGHQKYSMHDDNQLVRIAQLDDGQKIYEFIRFDNHWQGVGAGANSKGLANSISKKTLSQLKEKNGYLIVYTHLGMNTECDQFICQETQDALRNLATEYNNKNIYVTTTSKLLNYHVKHKYLDWSYTSSNNGTIIRIKSIKDPVFGTFEPTVHDLEGITFYVQDGQNAEIYINDLKINNLSYNDADYTGRKSVSIRSGGF